MTAVTLVVLGLFLALALATVMAPTVLMSAIGLALTSAVLTLAMFLFGAPLAGVFELSVCAGLITVVFISTISLTRRVEGAAAEARKALRLRAFLPLLGIVALVGLGFWLSTYNFDFALPLASPRPADVREVLWSTRRFDLIGQVLVIFAGVFGVVILFKERARSEKDGEEGGSR